MCTSLSIYGDDGGWLGEEWCNFFRCLFINYLLFSINSSSGLTGTFVSITNGDSRPVIYIGIVTLLQVLIYSEMMLNVSMCVCVCVCVFVYILNLT